MELNLRKARKLEAKISTFIYQQRANLRTDTNVRVNATSTDVTAQLTEARNEFNRVLENVEQLCEIRYAIRSSIGAANESSGINGKIVRRAMLKSKQEVINNIHVDEYFSMESIEDKQEVMKAQIASGNSYGSSTHFTAQFLKDEDDTAIASKRLDITREIEALDDDILELNYKTTIKLPADQVALLQTNSLL